MIPTAACIANVPLIHLYRYTNTPAIIRVSMKSLIPNSKNPMGNNVVAV